MNFLKIWKFIKMKKLTSLFWIWSNSWQIEMLVKVMDLLIRLGSKNLRIEINNKFIKIVIIIWAIKHWKLLMVSATRTLTIRILTISKNLKAKVTERYTDNKSAQTPLLSTSTFSRHNNQLQLRHQQTHKHKKQKTSLETSKTSQNQSKWTKNTIKT